jgi:hypothetical protein
MVPSACLASASVGVSWRRWLEGDEIGRDQLVKLSALDHLAEFGAACPSTPDRLEDDTVSGGDFHRAGLPRARSICLDNS